MKKLFALALFALAGCATPSGGEAVRYTCDNKTNVSAKYLNTENTSAAELLIDGKTLVLHEAVSASGARYESDHGLTPGTGLVWWTKGNAASLYALARGKETPIASCTAND